MVSCPECHGGEARSKVILVLSQPLIAQAPWEFVGVEVVGPFPATHCGHSFVCLICDFSTRWLVSSPMPDEEPVSIARALLDATYLYGSPQNYLINEGRKFIKEVKGFY